MPGVQKVELDLKDVSDKLADCGQQLEKAEAAKMELMGQVQHLKSKADTCAPNCVEYDKDFIWVQTHHSTACPLHVLMQSPSHPVCAVNCDFPVQKCSRCGAACLEDKG